jgi:hypothetical protein
MMTVNHSGIAAGILAAAIATACTRATDDVAYTHAAFAHPGTGQKFLLAFWSGDLDQVGPYNGEVFQGTPPAYPDDLATPKTLKAWKTKFMPSSEPTVASLYRNHRELGGGPGEFFWRDMKCTKRFVRGGPGGCLVTNYNEDFFQEGPFGDKGDNGTVAMSLTQDGFVHFALFEPRKGEESDATVETAEEAGLDSETDKITPHVCVNCHSGTIAFDQDLLRKPDLGSVFREFEPSLLDAPRGVSRATAEQQWYDLNQAVLAANAALRSESEGAPKGVEHSRQAIGDHIQAIYGGLGAPSSHPNPPFSHDLGSPELMPSSWRAQDADTKALWSTVVSPYCMECHRHNGLDFSDFANFSFLRPLGSPGGLSLLQQYVVDDGREDTGLPYMPQAQADFESLQGDLNAWDVMRRWSGLPQSDEVVRIPANQPGWPAQIALSTDRVTVKVPGLVHLRFVNETPYDFDVVNTFDGKDDENTRLHIPPALPGGGPAEVDRPTGFRGPDHGISDQLVMYNRVQGGGSHYITISQGF